MKISELKEKHDKKLEALFQKCEVFFAFSDEQFKKGCTRGWEDAGEKYYRLAGGGYYPKDRREDVRRSFNEFHAECEKDFQEHIPMDDYIQYELANHECWYTGECQDVLNVVLSYYPQCTLQDVVKVFQAGI